MFLPTPLKIAIKSGEARKSFFSSVCAGLSERRGGSRHLRSDAGNSYDRFDFAGRKDGYLVGGPSAQRGSSLLRQSVLYSVHVKGPSVFHIKARGGRNSFGDEKKKKKRPGKTNCSRGQKNPYPRCQFAGNCVERSCIDSATLGCKFTKSVLVAIR